MNKTISNCLFIVLFGVYLSIALCEPWVLSDKNAFLKSFVDHAFLSLLGVILAITLASAGNLHLEFNRLESKVRKSFLSSTRASVKRSSYSLIILFLVGFIVMIIKPLVPQVEIAMALINGLAVLVVIFNVLVLIDLTSLVFKIEPAFKILPHIDDSNEATDE